MHLKGEKKLRLYGPVPEEGHWRPRWNSEIYGLYKDLNIVDGIKFRRLDLRVTSYEWKNKGSEKKKGFFGKFHKTKSVGKPRTRWEDVRRDALEILGIRGWMKRAGKNGRASLEGGQVSKGAVAPHVDV